MSEPDHETLCHTCGQLSLRLFLVPLLHEVAVVAWCPECDAGHCPRCRRHITGRPSDMFAKFCTECGAALALT